MEFEKLNVNYHQHPAASITRCLSADDIEAKLEEISLKFIESRRRNATKLNKSFNITKLSAFLKENNYFSDDEEEEDDEAAGAYEDDLDEYRPNLHHHHKYNYRVSASYPVTGSNTATMQPFKLKPKTTTTAIKKAVRFADSIGLELASVREIANPDSPPLIPRRLIKCLKKSAKVRSTYTNQSDDDDESSSSSSNCSSGSSGSSSSASSENSTEEEDNDMDAFKLNILSKSISQLNDSIDPNSFTIDSFSFKWKCGFEQPGIKPNFYSILNQQRVLLESIYTNHDKLDGIIRVVNQNNSNNRRVFVRYTLNKWRTYSDLHCTQLDKQNDRFKFSLVLDKKLISVLDEKKCISCDNCDLIDDEPSFQIEFAICYELDSSNLFWDNNHGNNYKFDCIFKILSPSLSSNELKTKSHPFY